MLPLDTTQEIDLTHEPIPESEHCDYIERSQLAERRRSALVDTQPCIPAIEDIEATRRECACHAPNPDSARAARGALDAVMGEPLRLWGHMMAELRGVRP